jgi:hypothetical protein
MDLLIERLMMEVSDETGVVVRIEEVLQVDACSHKLQHLLWMFLLQQSFHLLQNEGEIGLNL